MHAIRQLPKLFRLFGAAIIIIVTNILRSLCFQVLTLHFIAIVYKNIPTSNVLMIRSTCLQFFCCAGFIFFDDDDDDDDECNVTNSNISGKK